MSLDKARAAESSSLVLDDTRKIPSWLVDSVASSVEATTAISIYSLDGTYIPRPLKKQQLKRKAFLSNVFFLSGSLLYVCVACWDIHRLRHRKTSILPSPSQNMDDFSGGFPDISLYHTICIFAPLCYATDAVLQLGRLPIASSGHLHQGFHDKPILEAGVQLTFGTAAICDLLSALIYREASPSTSYDLSIVAVHWYLINAILMLSSKQAFCRSQFTRLSLVGDVLFLIGSMIDVCLSYFFNTQTSVETWRLVNIGKVLSSLLWVGDSLLYILADVYEEEDEDSLYGIINEEASIALVQEPQEPPQ